MYVIKNILSKRLIFDISKHLSSPVAKSNHINLLHSPLLFGLVPAPSSKFIYLSFYHFFYHQLSFHLDLLITSICPYAFITCICSSQPLLQSKKTMDMEQYMVGCLSFDVSEYFKRYLATNATVRMFTRLLSYHASNDVSVNHYAFCYLQRLCSFRLQQDFVVPPRPVRGYNGLSDPSSVPLSATSSLGGAIAPVGKEHLPTLTLL